MSDLLDLLAPGPGDGAIHGLVTAVVTNNQDPERLGRVKLRFPWLSADDESGWARVAAPMAGKERGVFFLPEVDDEVLVLFEQGDPRFPYVIGQLWNAGAPPFETNEDGANDVRAIRSRSGHVIRLNDRGGEETIEIVDRTGNNAIRISSKDGAIAISADGDVSITGRTVRIESTEKLTLKGAGGVDVNDGAIEVS